MCVSLAHSLSLSSPLFLSRVAHLTGSLAAEGISVHFLLDSRFTASPPSIQHPAKQAKSNARYVLSLAQRRAGRERRAGGTRGGEGSLSPRDVYPIHEESSPAQPSPAPHKQVVRIIQTQSIVLRTNLLCNVVLSAGIFLARRSLCRCPLARRVLKGFSCVQVVYRCDFPGSVSVCATPWCVRTSSVGERASVRWVWGRGGVVGKGGD